MVPGEMILETFTLSESLGGVPGKSVAQLCSSPGEVGSRTVLRGEPEPPVGSFWGSKLHLGQSQNGLGWEGYTLSGP